MIERLREGRLRETCMKEKREKKAIREEGEQESEEDRMKKKGRDKGYPLLLVRIAKREREMVEPGGGCATEEYHDG